MRLVVIAAGLLAASPAVAQVSNPPVGMAVDTSNLATKADLAAAQTKVDAATAAAGQARAEADKAKADAAAVAAAAAAAQARADAAATAAATAKTTADTTATSLAAAQTAATNAKAAADAAKTAADTVSSRVEAVALTVPKPATSVPPTEMLGGTVGTAGTYRPADGANPRITRAGLATTSASTGDWSITWTTPLTAVPVVLPIPVNTTAQPLVCNVATRSMTGATGRCWLARTLPATLLSLTALVTYDVFGAPATGVQVQILAIPPTQ